MLVQNQFYHVYQWLSDRDYPYRTGSIPPAADSVRKCTNIQDISNCKTITRIAPPMALKHRNPLYGTQNSLILSRGSTFVEFRWKAPSFGRDFENNFHLPGREFLTFRKECEKRRFYWEPESSGDTKSAFEGGCTFRFFFKGTSKIILMAQSRRKADYRQPAVESGVLERHYRQFDADDCEYGCSRQSGPQKA